jgi:hypothetical protein
MYGKQKEREQMNEFTRITVPLSRDEFFALRAAAGKEYRHPREQARWLLRQVLMQESGEDEPHAQSAPVNQDFALA